MTKRYDEDSIRVIQGIASRPIDGIFKELDAEALAKFRQTQGLAPKGEADEAFLDFLLSKVGPTVAARNALIHLVVDHAGLDVSGVLSVQYEASPTTKSAISGVSMTTVSEITIGDLGFASYKTMVAEIKKELTAAKGVKGAAATAVPKALLDDPTKQEDAIAFNSQKLKDPRSIRLIQGRTGSKATGSWDAASVRHLALKQQAMGRSVPDGKIDDGTIETIATELIASLEFDAVLHLIIDYYQLDHSHTFAVKFTPIRPAGVPSTANADTTGLGMGIGGVSTFFPEAFQQPWAGLVHTVAHELGHIQQVIAGIASLDVREFLSEGIEIESKGMPQETIESDADIDLMIRGQPALTPGLLDDAGRMLHFWGRMTAAEKQAQHTRFKAIRTIIVNRINSGTSNQRTKLAPFITRLNNADAGVP